VVQVTLKHLLVPNGYIPGMFLIYSSLHQCTFVHTGSMYFAVRCFNRPADVQGRPDVCTVQCCLFYFWSMCGEYLYGGVQ